MSKISLSALLPKGKKKKTMEMDKGYGSQQGNVAHHASNTELRSTTHQINKSYKP